MTTNTDVHTCSYYCERPECIKRQRDEMRDRMAAALVQQPAAAMGEEIMVNAAHGVYTLPLQPSWLLSGPRFVVYVPAPEQQPAAPSGAVNVVGMPEFDGLMDHIHEYGTTADGVVERANAFARAVLARYAPQQPAAVDEAMVERIAALLHEEATGEPWIVAGVEHPGPDRDYYRGLARKVAALAAQQQGGAS